MIRLTIIKAPDAGTCIGSDMVFGPGGGTVGRSRNSTWALIDNDFLVSRVHAEIHADGGQYFVTDRSTNGLFLNQARKPLGFGETTPLRNGDHMHLGHYTLSITMEAAAQSISAAGLGTADFLREAALAESTFATDAAAIPDHWLREHEPFASSDNNTLINDRSDELISASWFENSLRMMLAPVVGSNINTMSASDLIALVTQLARTATNPRAPAGDTTSNR